MPVIGSSISNNPLYEVLTMQVPSVFTPTQISEAKQAIYRLASFPESRADLRITNDLNIISAQGRIQKIVSFVTCDCCCSRIAYDRRTNLACSYSHLRETVRILVATGELQNNSDLQDACECASRVFNSFIQHCSSKRSKELDHLKVDMPSLIKEMTDRENASPTMKPAYPRRKDGSIDFSALFQRSHPDLSTHLTHKVPIHEVF